MLARSADADVVVVGLVGERGREVREFIERDLGGGLARAVVIVATSDESALKRVRAALIATTVAEHFRGQGRRVLLLVDSLSRVAQAQREIGLAAGEPPTTKGYPPSAFAILPRLLERAGNDAGDGSMTAFYTVLAEGDDATDPIADAAKATLRHAREILSSYREAADLIEVGAYVAGSNPKVDRALRCIQPLRALLRQAPDERWTMSETLSALATVLAGAEAPRA
jgi:flagellum-specific ATP synthase